MHEGFAAVDLRNRPGGMHFVAVVSEQRAGADVEAEAGLRVAEIYRQLLGLE